MEVSATTAAQQQRKRKPIQLSKTKLFHLHLMAVLPPLPKQLLLFLTRLVEAREVVELPEVVEARKVVESHEVVEALGEVIPPKGLGRILLRDLHKSLKAPGEEVEEETGEEMEEEKEMEKDVEDEDYNIVIIYSLLFFVTTCFFSFYIIKLR